MKLNAAGETCDTVLPVSVESPWRTVTRLSLHSIVKWGYIKINFFKCCKKSIAPAICDPNTAECKVKCSKHIQCGKHSLCFSAIQYKAENREPRLTERGNVVVWAFSTCVKANHRTEPDKVCKVTNPRFNDCECVGHKCNRIVHLSGTHVSRRPADLIDSFADGQLGQGQD